MMKKLAMLLFIISLAFAAPSDWIPTAGAALILSVLLVTLIYIIGHGFSINELKFLATEEYYQIIVTLLMLLTFIGASLYIDALSNSFGLGESLQSAAFNVVEQTLSTQLRIYNGELLAFSARLGSESSKSFFCTLQGLGYNVAPCSSFRALSSPLAIAFQAMSLAISELNSLRTLLEFGNSYAFQVLLPIGILLRALKFTRGAGGIFIGMAAALYFFVPLSIIFMDNIFDAYEAPSPDRASMADMPVLPKDFECNPEDEGLANFRTAKGLFANLNGALKYYLYNFLLRSTLTVVVALVTFIATVRWLTKIAGAEIDLSAIARIA